MDVNEWNARPRNMVCHNTLGQHAVSVGVLGLGLNYRIKSTSTNETTKNNHERLTKDIRRIYDTQEAEKDDSNYIPSLYIKSGHDFDPASPPIEISQRNFQQTVVTKQPPI